MVGVGDDLKHGGKVREKNSDQTLNNFVYRYFFSFALFTFIREKY